MKKNKKTPLLLTIAETAKHRLTQVGPGRFVLEESSVDAHGTRSWHVPVFGVSDKDLADLIHASRNGLIDISAPWAVAAHELALVALIIGIGIGLVVGVLCGG